MPADPTPHGATAAGGAGPHGYHPGTPRAVPERRRAPAARPGRPAGRALGDRRRQARPGRRRRRRHAHLRWPHRRRGRPPRDPARRHHRPDRTQRRRQDDAVQPAHRLRPARHGHVVLRRQVAGQAVAAPGRPARRRPHVPAHQGAVPAHRPAEHAAGRTGPARRGLLPRARPGHLEGAGEGQHREGDGPAPALQAGRQEGRLRRHPLRRSAQAARDGAGAHERPAGGHARRADGRREPGAHAEPARATSRTCASRA